MKISFTFSTAIALLSILIAGITIRLLFRHINYMPPVAPDSIGYYLRAQQFYSKPSLVTFIGTARTPVFPFLLSIPFLIRGELHLPLTASSTHSGIGDLFAIQHAIGIGAAMVFFLVLAFLHFKYTTRLFLSLILVTNLLIVPWEWTVLTESWGAAWCVLYLAGLIGFLRHPAGKTAVVSALIIIAGIFLRPALLPLGIIAPTLTALCISPWKHRLLATLTLVLVMGSVGLYTLLNGLTHQGYIFQSVSSINVMGRILGHGIPVSTNDHSLFAERVRYYRKNGYTLDPFALLDNTPQTATFDSDLQAFVNRTIMAAPLATIQSLLVDAPGAVLYPSSGVVINPLVVSQPLAQHLAFLQRLHQMILSISILITPLILLPILRHRQQLPEKVLSITGVSVIMVILPTLLYNYEDYARFFVPYIPLYLLLFGYLMELIMTLITKVSNKKT